MYAHTFSITYVVTFFFHFFNATIVRMKQAVYGLAVLISLIAAGISYTSGWNDALTFDEVVYIPAGYAYVHEQDMRLNPEHPPLFKLLAALPLLFISVDNTAFTSTYWTEGINAHWEFGKQFLFSSNNDPVIMMRLSRIPMLLFFIATSILLFHAIRKKYGDKAGLVGVLVFSLSPTLLAHSKLVVNDVAVLWGIFTAVYCFVALLQKPTWARTIGTGVVLGIALVTKFSSILLIPFFIALTLLFIIIHVQHNNSHISLSWKNLVGKVIVSFGIAYSGMVYPLYAFTTFSYPTNHIERDIRAHIEGRLPSQILERFIIASADVPVLPPFSLYAVGVSMNVIRSTGGNTYFFNGVVSTDATPWYFPTLYSVKEPVSWILFAGSTFIVFLLYAATVLYRRRHILSSPRTALSLLLSWMVRTSSHAFFEVATVLWIILYGSISLAGNLNIGIRHILPLYPFIVYLTIALCIYLISRLYKHNIRLSNVRMTILIGTAVAIYAYESLSSYPHFIAYNNAFGGGIGRGGEIATDSNVDWGQDILRLSHVIQKRIFLPSKQISLRVQIHLHILAIASFHSTEVNICLSRTSVHKVKHLGLPFQNLSFRKLGPLKADICG